MPVLGMDTSNFTGPLTAENATQLRNSMGIDRAIIATTFPDSYASQLQACKQAGMYCEAYIYLNNVNGKYYSGKDYAQQALDAANIVKQDVTRLWIDLEDVTGQLPTEADILGALESVQSAGLAVGIYTASWYWSQIGNPQLGYLAPLWNANYDKSYDGANTFSVWYGGWTMALVKQYDAGVQQYGLNLDLDVWRV